MTYIGNNIHLLRNIYQDEVHPWGTGLCREILCQEIGHVASSGSWRSEPGFPRQSVAMPESVGRKRLRKNPKKDCVKAVLDHQPAASLFLWLEKLGGNGCERHDEYIRAYEHQTARPLTRCVFLVFRRVFCGTRFPVVNRGGGRFILYPESRPIEDELPLNQWDPLLTIRRLWRIRSLQRS